MFGFRAGLVDGKDVAETQNTSVLTQRKTKKEILFTLFYAIDQ
jgi:hypothetical protein